MFYYIYLHLQQVLQRKLHGVVNSIYRLKIAPRPLYYRIRKANANLRCTVHHPQLILSCFLFKTYRR